MVLGGVVGLYVVSRFMGGGSGGSDMSGYFAAQAQASAANNQVNAQLSAQSMQFAAQKYNTDLQYALESQKIESAQNIANLNGINAYNESIGNMALKGASAAAEIVGAYLALPASAINAASAENQAALSAAAKVAATGIAATPANLSGAADLLQAAYKPLDYVGKIVSGFSTNVSNANSNVINSMASMSADIVDATGQTMSQLGTAAANANAQSSAATSRMIGQLAMAAAMA
jgi:hypothetical protein